MALSQVPQEDLPIRIKGSGDGLLITVSERVADDWLGELEAEFSGKPGFWRGGRVVLIVGERAIALPLLRTALEMLDRYGMRLWAVLSENEDTRRAARELGLAVRVPGVSRAESKLPRTRPAVREVPPPAKRDASPRLFVPPSANAPKALAQEGPVDRPFDRLRTAPSTGSGQDRTEMSPQPNLTALEPSEFVESPHESTGERLIAKLTQLDAMADPKADETPELQEMPRVEPRDAEPTADEPASSRRGAREVAEANVESEEDGADQPATGPAPALILKETLRGGRSVRHAGAVIILGDVNPGAEVKAGGDVIVWGKLRGLVHAGFPNDDSACVCALDLNPTQLRIADKITVPPKDPRRQPVPEMAVIREQHIVAERWRPKT